MVQQRIIARGNLGPFAMRRGLSGKRARMAAWAASAGLGASGAAMVATCGGFPGACDWTLGAIGRGAGRAAALPWLVLRAITAKRCPSAP